MSRPRVLAIDLTIVLLGASLWLVSRALASGSVAPESAIRFEKALLWNEKVVGPVTFAPDGKTAIACGLDWVDDVSLPSVLRVWNVDSGERIADITVPDAKIISIAVGRGGRNLCSASFDGTIRLHDLRSSKSEIIDGVVGHEVIFSPDGSQFIASAGYLIQLVNLTTRKVLVARQLGTARDTPNCPAAFSPDGKLVVIARQGRSGTRSEAIEICDSGSLATVQVLEGAAPAVTSVRFSPDGGLVAAGRIDGTVTVWNLNNRSRQRVVRAFLPDDHRRIAGVEFSPDGRILAVGGDEAAVFVSMETFGVKQVIKGQGVFTLAFSPDGRRLITNCSRVGGSHETKLWTLH